MSSEVKKIERQNLLVQVEDFLKKQSKTTQKINKKQDIESEVGLFLNLLGNINPPETPQNQNQLSTIISQGSYDSPLPSYRETKYKYVDQFVQQMLDFLRNIKKDCLQNEIAGTTLIEQFYKFYLKQMNDIDSLIQYTYDVGNRKYTQIEGMECKEIKQTALEQDLENSLFQAHQLNDQLNHLLKLKSSENYFKDKQCKQALQSVAILESQLKQFQGQFKQFNQVVKQINNQLTDCVQVPFSENRNRLNNNKTTYKSVNSYRTHFTSTTPNKKGKLEENYRSTSQTSYRSRRDEVEKVYKQLLKNYV